MTAKPGQRDWLQLLEHREAGDLFEPLWGWGSAGRLRGSCSTHLPIMPFIRLAWHTGTCSCIQPLLLPNADLLLQLALSQTQFVTQIFEAVILEGRRKVFREGREEPGLLVCW